MSPQDLLYWTRRRPFVPFRLHISDGTVYEVTHPELCMPGISTAVIGLPHDPANPIFERIELVTLSHVVRLEPLAAPASA